MNAQSATPKTALVVAHPDDEALWLSSVIAAVDRTIFCFGELHQRPKKSAARQAAIAALPLDHVVDLAIPESGARLLTNLAHPQLTSFGLAINDPAARSRYEASFAHLIEKLRLALAGTQTVYTHNPWGEYGHVDHVQVYRAVRALQEEIGYSVWFTNYVDEASMPLARVTGAQTYWDERIAVATNPGLARRLMRTYRRHGAWTWSLFHRWPEKETHYREAPRAATGKNHTLIGEELLDVAGLRWWPPPYRRARRILD